MTMRRTSTLLLGALLALLTLAKEVLAAPALGDYNGDGSSDLAVAQVDRRAGTTAWLARLSNRSDFGYWTFGVPGDALVTGKWFGDGKTYPGVVWVRDAKLPLEWYLKNPQGGDVFLKYGIPGDTVPNQGDLDCDGITDFTVVRNGTSTRYPGLKVWYVALSSRGGLIVEDVFGFASDRVALADLDGDGCSELMALRSGFTWFGKKLLQSNFSQVQWGLPGDYPLLPQDMNNDGVAEYMVARATGAGQVIYIRYSSSFYETLPAGLDTSIPLIGNFVGVNSVAWHQRNTGGAAILQFNRTPQIFNFGISTNAIIRPDGTVIQPNEDGKFGSSGSGGGGDSGGSGGGGVGNASCDRELDITDGYGNNKYRPSSSRGRKFMFERRLYGYIRAVSSFDQAGNKIDNWEVFGTPEYTAGPRTRIYSGKSPGSMPSNEVIVAELTDGSTVCAVIPDPRREWD